jgi:hypothetical protein
MMVRETMIQRRDLRSRQANLSDGEWKTERSCETDMIQEFL